MDRVFCVALLSCCSSRATRRHSGGQSMGTFDLRRMDTDQS